jgi:hypothetical protein
MPDVFCSDSEVMCGLKSDSRFVVRCRCGNVAAILELDEHLEKKFTVFEAAPQVSYCFSLSLYAPLFVVW